jgi:hypothetical protein
MTDEIDPILMRAFAEAPRPADDGPFTAATLARIAAAERRALLWNGALVVAGLALAALLTPMVVGATLEIGGALASSAGAWLALSLAVAVAWDGSSVAV